VIARLKEKKYVKCHRENTHTPILSLI